MLGFSMKYIDSEKMILDDWSPDLAVFDFGHLEYQAPEDEEEELSL